MNDNKEMSGENDEKNNMAESIRLQKFISECGVMSRRAAEKAISDGLITVNGTAAELGTKINPGLDEVRINGKLLSDKVRKGEKIYLMLNKPVGYVTTMKDEKGRKCVSELVSDIGARVYPVGRLDYQSEGLLIMTNDGELTNRLTHPRHKIPKIYNVTVSGAVDEEQRKILTSPLEIDGYRIIPVDVKIKASEKTFTVLRFELYEGRNRQIRKMCEAAGLKIRRLVRIAIGKITLGDLNIGCYRYLSDAEVEYLTREC